MWHQWLVAVSLVLVIEGLLPFVSPRGWRDAVVQIARLPPHQIRIVGLISMLVGTLLLYLVNH